MVKKYAFCHGWMVSPNDHNEITCKQRERCQYFDVDFYRKHVHHLDEFEELFPMAPCPYFLPSCQEQPPDKKAEDALSLFMQTK